MPEIDKNLRFAEEYLVDLNQTQAYIRVVPGTKPATAATLGWRMLRKVDVQEHLARLVQEITGATRRDAQACREELERIGFSDVKDYVVGSDGRITLRPGADPLATRAVSKVKCKTTVKTFGTGERAMEVVEHSMEYGLWNKPQALRTLLELEGKLGQDRQLAPGEGRLTVEWRKE